MHAHMQELIFLMDPQWIPEHRLQPMCKISQCQCGKGLSGFSSFFQPPKNIPLCLNECVNLFAQCSKMTASIPEKDWII